MARLKGIIKLEGTLDNLTFYKGEDGYLVRTKGGVSKDRIMNDPAFVRTRENGFEFGHSATAGKLLRKSVRNLMIQAKDNRVTSRLTQTMTKIKNADTTSARGERKVAVGLATPEGKAALKGFNFNKRSLLSAVLYSNYSVDETTGEIEIANLIPTNDIAYPSGATHISLSSAFLNLDFDTEEYAVETSPKVNLPIDTTSATQTLTPAAVPSGSGNNIFLLLIEFFQEINGEQYPLKNGAYNVLNIVEVS
ncbi:hypothetical protein [Mesonia aquimarina]|uniref:hypothetical protein n=1 Tax=Mesonia aquimarina TaxID=1504967 RepID=UPI000EF564EB|nr:hypothetical protein [Mesonia aquimarina]